MRRSLILLTALATVIAAMAAPAAAKGNKTNDNAQVQVNVLLNTDITDEILAELGQIGRVRDTLVSIDAVFMQARLGDLDAIRALSFVEGVNPDAERYGSPVDTVAAEDFADGLSTWNLDAINVTDFGFDNRKVGYDGTGVYVAVLDTGLVDQWRQYFPEERIATEYAISFGGGGGERGNVSTQPNKWEHDTNSHGTHVTSTILGYSLDGTPVNGVAPGATVIPVKVLQSGYLGFGWSSTVAAGITHVADLKAGPLADAPVVINMSLGGPTLDQVEKAAIDYAISQGVIIVASAGNSGDAGMGYPGAYEPVISVAAAGWIGEWVGSSAWWYLGDVAEPTEADDFYITDFSSRALAGQDLDVTAPGSWVVGPFNLQQGKTSYYFLGGTSMASPHVAGVVALMAEKHNDLNASDAESILESEAIPLAAACRDVSGPTGEIEEFCWGADATGAGLVDADAALAATP